MPNQAAIAKMEAALAEAALEEIRHRHPNQDVSSSRVLEIIQDARNAGYAIESVSMMNRVAYILCVLKAICNHPLPEVPELRAECQKKYLTPTP